MSTTYAELCQFINDAGMDLITDEGNNLIRTQFPRQSPASLNTAARTLPATAY